MLQDSKKLTDRYDLIKKLGQGGMATVYLAWDTHLERHVAIKVIDDKQIEENEGIERFIREAKIISSLNHPNIVHIHDIVHQDDTYFIVMEYIDGPSLNDLLETSQFNENQVISFATQICSGLAHAHEKGIVHRDIKPHNILLASNGNYKIVDFGISKYMDSTQLTLTGIVMGSVHYFSPEQASGQAIKPSSDIYSLGIVMYEMLSGNVPFDAENYIAIAVKHMNEPVPDRLLNINVTLKQIVLKALEKNPTKRFQTATEMKSSLEKIQQNQQKLRSTKSPKKKKRFLNFILYSAMFIALLVGSLFVNNWIHQHQEIDKPTNNTNQTLPSTPDISNQPKGTHPWWKELPKKNSKSYIFHHRKVVGSDGEYDVSTDLGGLPSTKFYYNIYVVDTFNSRKIISKKTVRYKRSVQSTLTHVQFHVSIPKTLLPSEGIVKIEFYWTNNPDKQEDYVIAEESLLQQWGQAPQK